MGRKLNPKFSLSTLLVVSLFLGAVLAVVFSPNPIKKLQNSGAIAIGPTGFEANGKGVTILVPVEQVKSRDSVYLVKYPEKSKLSLKQLQFLSNFPNLKVLIFADCELPSNFSKAISNLGQLERLFLGGSDFSDEDLAGLRCDNLILLDVFQSGVTNTAVSDFKKARPHVQVVNWY